MKLLVLGGTVFLGRHTVEAALQKGHEVTMFNRGQHNPDLFPEVEKLRGDRDGNLKALEGRRWDAVIDTCGYVPRIVAASASLLADQVEHYTFVSSISVYSDFSQSGIDERSPVGMLEDESVEEITGETYGPLKVLCEQAVERALPGRTCNVRAGLIVGPHDLTDRFTYWPKRVAQGGEMLAPDNPEYPVQWVDVRDLAEWMIHIAETRQVGPYNATGPDSALTMGGLLEACKTATQSDADFVWVEEEFLLEHEATPWAELPLWVPKASSGIMQVNCQKAFDAGLTFRPMADTINDTLAWDKTRPADTEMKAGLPFEKEKAILDAWRMKV